MGQEMQGFTGFTRSVRTRRLLAPLLATLLAIAGCSAAAKKAAYEPEDRDTWQKPAEVISLLDITPGSTLVDLGSGGGYFTGRLGRATGPAGKVFAVDVDPTMNALLGTRLAEEDIRNVTIVTADPNHAGLAPNSIDLVFVSNTYHHLPDPVRYFARLLAALRPGGRVAILEYHPDANTFVRLFRHGTAAVRIRDEMSAAGYMLLREKSLERQDLLIFRPARAASRAGPDAG